LPWMAWPFVACLIKPSLVSLYPMRLSFDHDPLFQFPRWQANLRILGIKPIQSVPRVPVVGKNAIVPPRCEGRAI